MNARNMVEGLAQLIHLAINIYIIIIVVRSVLSWMGNVPPNPLVRLLRRLTDPVFRLVYRIIPYRFLIIGNIDVSPIIIILALYLVDNLVFSFLMGYAYQLGLPGGY